MMFYLLFWTTKRMNVEQKIADIYFQDYIPSITTNPTVWNREGNRGGILKKDVQMSDSNSYTKAGTIFGENWYWRVAIRPDDDIIILLWDSDRDDSIDYDYDWIVIDNINC